MTTTPTPRHPLVDAWIDAGILVDATFHALYDGTDYARPYTSFAVTFGDEYDTVTQYDIVEHTVCWARSVEQNCRVAATKQIVMNLVNHVARRAEEAARALTAEALNSKTAPAGELYSIYLNNFIEYLTPSTLSGKVADGVVKEVVAMRRRCGAHTDVNMLRAQAQGIVDAVAAETGRAQSLPRGLDDFCAHIGVVRT